MKNKDLDYFNLVLGSLSYSEGLGGGVRVQEKSRKGLEAFQSRFWPKSSLSSILPTAALTSSPTRCLFSMLPGDLTRIKERHRHDSIFLLTLQMFILCWEWHS